MQAAAAQATEFFSCLVTIGTRKLIACLPALARTEAQAVMGVIAEELGARFARAELYIPANCSATRQSRDRQIYEQHRSAVNDGGHRFTAAELAREHGLSVRQVRAILSRQRSQAPGLAPQLSSSKRCDHPQGK